MITNNDTKKRFAKEKAKDKFKTQQASSDEEEFSLPSHIMDISASFTGSSKSISNLNSASKTLQRKALPFSSGTKTFLTAIM